MHDPFERRNMRLVSSILFWLVTNWVERWI